MGHVWQLQEAEGNLSRLLEQALQDGPQVISKQGVETAVVLSVNDYRRMLLHQKRLSEFFRDSPLVGVPLDVSRDKTLPRREIAL